MRPPSHQPRPHPPTATPIRHARTPIRHSCALRHSCAPLRHSCAGRNPCDHHRINHARTLRRPSDPSFLRPPPSPRSVIPAQAGIHATTIASTTPDLPTATPIRPHAREARAPSVIPAPPSVIPAQAGIHATTIASTTPAPADGPPINHTRCLPTRPAVTYAPVRHPPLPPAGGAAEG